ncbi:MAG TPA: DUF6134 family protein [Alphaproteobacteria bacterium]|nr:DUF6134 family protein [Alphaproteobacteria bacterium]
MMTRRDFLLGCGAAPLAEAEPYVPPCGDGRLAFRVLRNGGAIGSHTLDFVPQDDGFDVRIAIDIKVGFGPITLFRYNLTGTERWRGGMLISSESATNHDGKKVTFSCRREGDGLSVSGSQVSPYRAPGEALTASHWNKAELRAPWINLEDGRLMRPKVEPAGLERLRRPDGTFLAAERYMLSGDATLDLWYEPNRRWASLVSRAQDGSEIRYDRI